MPSNTTNYNIPLYDRNTDNDELFVDYRDDLSGTGAGSAMNIIDTQLKANADSVTDLAGGGRTTQTVVGNATNITNLDNKSNLVGVFSLPTTGTNSYATTNSYITSYHNGLKLNLQIGLTNTALSTININALGAKALKKINGSEFEAGELVAGRKYSFEYNGTEFRALTEHATKSTVKATTYTTLDARLEDMEEDVESILLSESSTFATNDPITSLTAGSLDGKITDLEFKGLSLVNIVNGYQVTSGFTVSFNSVLNNIYYDSLHNVNITGTGSSITVTNDLLTTADIMIIDKTSLGITGLSLDAMYNLTRVYFYGLQGVKNPILSTVGKNLINIENSTLSFTLNSSGAEVASTTDDTSEYIKVKSSTTYYLSGKTTAKYYALYDTQKTFISATSNTNGTIATTANTAYIKISYLKTNKDVIQLEQNTVATAYSEHKSSILSADVELRSLPNGVKDRVYEADGQMWLEKNVSDVFTIDGTEAWQSYLYNAQEDVSFMFLLGFTAENGIKAGIWTGNGGVLYEDSRCSFSIATIAPFEIYVSMHAPASLGVSDIATFKAWLASNPQNVIFQLATPELINLTEQGLVDGELMSFENGTFYSESDTFHVQNVHFNTPVNRSAQVDSLIESMNYQSKAIEAKANKVSESYDVTLLNTWINASTDKRLMVHKDALGNIFIDGEIINGVTSIGTTLAILPEQFRPRFNTPIYAIDSMINVICILQLYTDGTLAIVNTLSGAGLRINATVKVGE